MLDPGREVVDGCFGPGEGVPLPIRSVNRKTHRTMARTAAAGSWSQARACVRTARRCFGAPSWLAAGLILTGLTFSGACRAEPVKGEATFSAAGGYARLVLKLADDVGSEVTTAGSIVVRRRENALGA